MSPTSSFHYISKNSSPCRCSSATATSSQKPPTSSVAMGIKLRVHVLAYGHVSLMVLKGIKKKKCFCLCVPAVTTITIKDTCDKCSLYFNQQVSLRTSETFSFGPPVL